MTSDTEPKGIVTAHAENTSTGSDKYVGKKYQAFDGKPETSWYVVKNADCVTSKAWIMYEFDKSVCIKYIELLYCFSEANTSRKIYMFVEGQKEDGEWENITSIIECTPLRTYECGTSNYYGFKLYQENNISNNNNIYTAIRFRPDLTKSNYGMFYIALFKLQAYGYEVAES